MTITLTVKEDASGYSHTTPNKIENPHDKLFKETFGHLEVAQSFLHNYLPQHVMEMLNTDTLELEKDSFINNELEEGFSDLLFSADINGREGYVYFLFEHKSYPDKAIAFQLLKYMAEIWNTKIKKEKMNQVPLVIPLVIYHGASEWNTEKTLGGMISGYRGFPEGIRKFAPDYEYLIYDITNYTDEEIKGEARVRILFTMFRDVQKAENVQELLEIIDKAVAYLQELDDKQTGIEYFETFMLYIINTAKNIAQADVNQIVKRVGTIYPEGSEVIMTIADIWKEEGKEEGIRKVAKNAVKEGVELRLIEKLTGLSRNEVEEIAKEMKK